MANLPFIVKIFASCFSMNEDPLCRLRSARTHGCRSCSACTDSFSSFTDSESVVLPATSASASTGTSTGTRSSTGTGNMSWYPCEDDFDTKRESKGSPRCLVDSEGRRRRRLHEKDIRSNQRKRFREDSSYFCNTFSMTDQEASYFANLNARDGEEPRRKKLHVSLPPDLPVSGHLVKRAGLNRVEAFLSARTKASLALFRRELNYVKSQLNISQARCELLQDENRWLRANMQDEDSLLRHEVEMLLANKSQLALDNAYLIRERERLLQLVEYFQKGSPLVDS